MNDLDRIDGLYLGQLSPAEMKLFEQSVREGKACRSYNHFAAAALGLAKVRVIGR